MLNITTVHFFLLLSGLLFGYDLLRYLPADGYMHCFQFLAIANKAVVNIHIQVFVWIYPFFALG